MLSLLKKTLTLAEQQHHHHVPTTLMAYSFFNVFKLWFLLIRTSLYGWRVNRAGSLSPSSRQLSSPPIHKHLHYLAERMQQYKSQVSMKDHEGEKTQKKFSGVFFFGISV